MNRNRLWRLFLFLAVLILPSIGIAVQSRTIDREEKAKLDRDAKDRERDERVRADADKEVAAGEFAQAMLGRLDLIMAKELISARPGIPQTGAVALIGVADGDDVVWSGDEAKESPLLLMEDQGFAQTIEDARRARLADNIDRATDLYRGLIYSPRSNPRQRAVAILQFGQMLVRAARQGDADEARRSYLDLLNLPWNLTDKNDLPVASYAAQYLTRRDAADTRPAVGLDAADVKRAFEMQNTGTLGKTRLLLPILELLEKSEDAGVRAYVKTQVERVKARIADLEALSKVKGAAALQKAFPKLGVKESLWIHYPGPEGGLWLVGRASDSLLVLVVRAETVRSDIESSGALGRTVSGFETGAGGEGKPLGIHFPDLRAVFRPVAVGGGTKRDGISPGPPLYSLWLWMVVPFTFLGGYLVWSDTRREVRVADMRSQFVSSVSHELKTPLTAIRMFAETLQMGGNDARTHDEYLETIVNESERLTRLLNNVLDFSRIERGQRTYTLEPTPLEDVLDAAARTMRYPLQEKGFLLSVNVGEGVPPVAADRDALQQAVLNLLTNAMKYSGKRREIEMRLTSEDGWASITVTDHGIGIPVREQPRIFEKFYRAHVPENRAIAGTGLGLALVAHVAEAHGGRVHVESNPGDGSTFSIRLPLNGAAA